MSLPRLDTDRAVLLVVDLQERLVPAMHESDRLVAQSEKLIRGCGALGLPVLVTEHAPDKLGPTVAPIAAALPHDTPIESKLRFSAFVEPIRHRLSRIGRPQVIVCGVEAHVCLLQTALDLSAAGYITAVCHDAIASRRPDDREAGIARLAHARIMPSSVEMALFEMTGEAGTERFRSILPMIR